MSRVPLLTRQGEVAIAKRIERGEVRITKALSRSLMVARYMDYLADQVRSGERQDRADRHGRTESSHRLRCERADASPDRSQQHSLLLSTSDQGRGGYS